MSLDEYKYALASNNPAIKEIEEQISFAKKSLKQSAENALSHAKIMEEELNQHRSENKRKVSRLPATEQGLLNIQRQYEIVAKQYEFLNKKEQM